jgi:ABC-type glycerol-3-phosphate transport system substrate-binding protein
VLSGEPSTLVDGWMWVMTAKNPERQGAALQFLTWMFDANRHGAYTRAVNMLPSTRTALRGWGSPRAYTEFAGTLLSNGILPLLDNQDSTAARELQNALIVVLSGERTAEEATQDVIDQLAG